MPSAFSVLRIRSLLEPHVMLFWAALVGVLGALATIAFREGLAGTQHLLGGHSGSFVEMAAGLSWPVRLVLPCAGGVLAGFFLSLAKRRADSAPNDYMEAIVVGDGRIPVGQTLLRGASSLCTISSGGSIGREGPMVQLAAMCASVVGSLARFDPRRLRLLVACGAAAGIASAYNAPIASAFFVTEIVLGNIAIDSLGPMMIAAVAANITMRRLPGYHPTYLMPAFPFVPGIEVALFIVLGGLAGLAAPQFLRLLDLMRRGFQRSGLPLPMRLGAGGLGVGLLSIWVPQVWGNGYSVVNSLLHSPWAWSAVLAILVFKVAATLCTAGSGAVGGIFTPTLFVGAALGQLFGQIVHGLFPGLAAAPAAYAIVGMGAFLAASTGAPLMAILMIFEMTLSYQIMLPLMLACVIAYFLARGVGGPSMYEVTARHRHAALMRQSLRATQMQALVEPAQTVLTLDASVSDMLAMFGSHAVKYIYIVDAANRYRGVVALRDLATAAMDGAGKSARDFLHPDLLPLITPDMTLADAYRQFLLHHGERLPVVQSKEEPLLLGAIRKTEILSAFAELQQKDPF